MPKDVANVVANSTKITHLPIIRERQTRRPVKCKGVQKHILHQNVHAFGINEFGIIFLLFSYQVPKNTNTATPRRFTYGYWHPWHLWRFFFNQVPISLKYYSTPRSLLMAIAVLGICSVGEC